MRTRFDAHVCVKHLTGMVYDVFWNTGWDTWGRVQLHLDKPKPGAVFVQALGGLVLPFHIRNALIKYLRIV
jgi:hypothetical protein